jgi:hypothetical protein
MSVLIFIDGSSLTALNEALRAPAYLADFDAYLASCRRLLRFGRDMYEYLTITPDAGFVKKYVLFLHEFAKMFGRLPGVHCLAKAGLPIKPFQRDGGSHKARPHPGSGEEICLALAPGCLEAPAHVTREQAAP